MKTKTYCRAGRGGGFNHNETLAGGLCVKTRVRAWSLLNNHNQTFVGGLRVKTALRAGDDWEARP